MAVHSLPTNQALFGVVAETTLLHCTFSPRAIQGFNTSSQDVTVTQRKPPLKDLPGRRKDARATLVAFNSIYISQANMLTNKSISELSIAGMSTRIECGRLVFAFCARASASRAQVRGSNGLLFALLVFTSPHWIRGVAIVVLSRSLCRRKHY